MTEPTPRRTITFEDLEAIQQKTRKPCGKQAYTLGTARAAVEIRNALAVLGKKTWSVTPCFNGCGGNIFHLSTKVPSSPITKKLNLPRPVSCGKRARKTTRWKKNREAYEVLSIGTWEDDGGALHQSDLEG